MSVTTQRPPGRRAGAAAGEWPPLLTLVVTMAAVAAGLGGAYNFVVLPLVGAFAGGFGDFTIYAQTAGLMARGSSPYAAFDARTIIMSGFDYPPFAAVVVRPLAVLSAHWAAITWLWVDVGALVGGMVITARAALPATWPRSRIAVLVALTFPPATYNLWLGQINTIIFLLLAIAFSDYVNGRRTRCGAVLGVAAGIKLAPVILLVVLARRGWWRGVVAGIGGLAGTVGIGLVALGWPVSGHYLTSILPLLNRDNGWLYNQTWNGVINRLAEHAVLAPAATLPLLHIAALAISAFTVGIVVVTVRGGKRTSAERGAEFGCGVIAMLLVGSVAWYSVYVHLLIALAAAIGLAWERRGQGRSLARWTIAAIAGIGVATSLAIAALTMPEIVAISHGPLWWVFLQAWSLPALLAAGLLVVMARTLRGQPTPRPVLRAAALAP